MIAVKIDEPADQRVEPGIDQVAQVEMPVKLGSKAVERAPAGPLDLGIQRARGASGLE